MWLGAEIIGVIVVYELTGTERKEESTEKVECGDIITTKYFNGDALVRVDKNVIVDAVFMAKAIQGQS